MSGALEALKATEQKLLEEVGRQPQDVQGRLAYAEWLRETLAPALTNAGRSKEAGAAEDRGRFILYQYRAENRDLPQVEREACRREADALLEQHRAEWDAPFAALGASRVEYRQGFPAHVDIRAADFLDHAGELFRAAPIQSVRLTEAAPHMEALASSPYVARLTTLDLADNDIGRQGAEALAASPHLANLSTLDLGGNNIGPEGVLALAACPHLAGLTSLYLGSNSLGTKGTRALAASPLLSGLATLDLMGNRLGAEAAQALAASPHSARLRHLYLGQNRIGPAGAQALADAAVLSNLTTLGLGGNGIGTQGAEALAASPHLGKLTTLHVAGNDITTRGVQALAERLNHLTSLDVENNGVGAHLVGAINRRLRDRQAKADGKEAGRDA